MRVKRVAVQIADDTLDRLLSGVQKPGRYAGREWNSITKAWSKVAVTLALGYPDVYEIGMSNLGLAILYDIVNAQPGLLAERFYAPWHDMEALMREAHIPLFSLESRRTLAEFDVVGFTLQHELTYSNVINLLDLAGLPIFAEKRTADMPIVIAGGSCCFNPEPMAPFFDLFVIGDGEQVILDILQTVKEWKKADTPHQSGRRTLLRQLAHIQGIYVPSFYEPTYTVAGTLDSFRPRERDLPASIQKRILSQLPPVPTRPVVPTIRIVHDRGTIEIQRGCSHGCRFCQAGMIYRPVRERPAKEILGAIDQLVESTGYQEIGLVSLSSSDHSAIQHIIQQTIQKYEGRRLSVSLPSLRIDSFSVKLAQTIQQSRKTGFTFAPEAGSQRLRDVINKGVTESDLIQTAEAVFGAGWNRVKLYFMIGLPSETDEDILKAVRLINTISRIGKKIRQRRVDVKVTLSTFIPKPFTPFQWEPLASKETVEHRQQLFRQHVRGSGIRLSWSDWNATWLEGVLSRGDRRVSAAIYRAWQLGAKFDAWDESFSPAIWASALAETGVRASYYATRRRPWEEYLPWDHIDAGVSRTFLQREAERSVAGELSPDCRQQCYGCGILSTFAAERAQVAAASWGCP